MEDGAEIPLDDFGLALDEPADNSDETDAYADDEAALDDTGILTMPTRQPQLTRRSRRVRNPTWPLLEAVLLFYLF